jgi:hypothetical protein
MMTINCGWSISAKKAIQQRWKHVALRQEQLFKQQKWSHQSCWKDKPADPNSCNFHTIMAWSQHPWHSLCTTMVKWASQYSMLTWVLPVLCSKPNRETSIILKNDQETNTSNSLLLYSAPYNSM